MSTDLRQHITSDQQSESEPLVASRAGELVAPLSVWIIIWLLSAPVIVFAHIGVGLLVAALVVVSAHELGHWTAARAVGLPAQIAVSPAIGLTLFDEPRRRVDSVVIAAAGPAASLLTAAACFAASGSHTWRLVAHISLVVGVANLAPVPVLDGGRIISALVEGPGTVRDMLRTMTSVGGTWFALVVGAMTWSADPISAAVVLLVAAGSAVAEWSSWIESRHRHGPLIMRRWVGIAVAASSGPAVMTATWITHHLAPSR